MESCYIFTSSKKYDKSAFMTNLQIIISTHACMHTQQKATHLRPSTQIQGGKLFSWPVNTPMAT